MGNNQFYAPDIITQSTHKPRKKIRLTSLFFTVGLLLISVNFLIEITSLFQSLQAHSLGGAVIAFAASITSQLVDA